MSLASIHSTTKSANTWDLIARRGLYVISNGNSWMAHLLLRVASLLLMMSFRGYFGYCDRTLLKVVSKFVGSHEDCVGYLLVVGVSGFARCKDLRYIVD